MSEASVTQPDDVEIHEDYFGFDSTEKWYFPDGKQFIEFRVMNEGDRVKFQTLTRNDVRFNRRTEEASLRADPAKERHALLEASVVGWHVFRAGQPVPFSIGSPGATFEQWLNNANPKLVDELEFAIRKANPWMQADMTVEEIDKEMDRLRELREQVAARERGE